jgi:hypothetical protein
MNKFIVFILIIAFALTACDAVATPTQAPTEPSPIPPTAEVVVVTVEVPVEVTAQQSAESPAAPMPTESQPPAPAATEAAPPAGAPAGGPVTVDTSWWGKAFKDVTYSNPSFSLRCQPTQITFNATVTDPAITAVDFYYRIEDRNGTAISEWKNFGRMQTSGSETFSLTLLGESVHPDLRQELAWFDFQLIGINRLGQVVDRTERIVQQITYTIDCQ